MAPIPLTRGVLAAVLLLCVAHGAGAAMVASAERLAALRGAPPIVNATDCLMRSFFIERALEVNPRLTDAQVSAMVDALGGGDPLMGAGCMVRAPAARPPVPTAPALTAAAAGTTTTVFADAAHGSDASGDGSLGAPFQSVGRAIAAVRAVGGGGGVVNLRGGGTFFLPATLTLTPADSGLSIQTYPADAELAWMSGSVPLTNLAWAPVNVSDGANVWRADLSAVPGLDNVTSLRLGGARLIRARYPNADPETGLPFAHHTTSADAWTPIPNGTKGVSWSPDASYARNDSACSAYDVSIGGTSCNLYTPPIAHYCGSANVPGGMVAGVDKLPHQPYADPVGAVVTAMHGGSWCSFSYEVGAYAFGALTEGDASLSSAAPTGTFTFARGGQQCGRPESSHGPIVIENVIEELDTPGEFHWNARTRVLTLWHNASSGTAPPGDGTLVAPQLSQLVAAAGSQAAPVTSLAFLRVGFRDTAPTLFAPHLAPSGSDYAVNREAALSFVGVNGVTVTDCAFTRLDNSGVFMGGFARGVVVADSEFAWLGENGIVSVGDTDGAPIAGWGPDGTAGNQPRGTLVARNFAHEIGIVNKQSCFYFQAVTDSAVIDSNIILNGARHGIQYNDDFGSGSLLQKTVAFNLNRETADTGLFNSWFVVRFLSRGVSMGP